jgi:hypothetical protein
MASREWTFQPGPDQWSIQQVVEHWLAGLIANASDAEYRRCSFRHSVAGPLNISQAIQLGILHIRSHLREIQRNRRLLVAREVNGETNRK